MKEVNDIIKTLREANIRLILKNDDLLVDASSGEIGEELIAAIRSNKQKLVSYLRKNLSNGSPVTIKPVPQQTYYPLSSSQRRLWILYQMNPESIEYNTPGAYLFEGDLNAEALTLAFRSLIVRHEILRTVFKENEEKKVMQYVYDVTDNHIAKLEYNDLREKDLNEKETEHLIIQFLNAPFDLVRGPLIRAALYQVSEQKYIFAYSLHHIISDNWSMSILIKELLMLYNAHVNGTASPLPPLAIQYKDYATWYSEQLNNNNILQHKDYWLQQFEGELPVLDLPADKERPSVRSNRGASLTGNIDKTLADGIKQLAQEQGGTLFMGLLAALNTLLYRYTNQHDIIVGMPVAGRSHAELEGQIGCYINTLALRNRFSGDDDFKSLLQIVRNTTLEAYSHQIFPFDELIDALPLKRDMSRTALFDVLVDFHDHSLAKGSTQPDGLHVTLYEPGEHTVSKFDLTFGFMAYNDELKLSIEYNTDLYHRETIETLSGHFNRLLQAIVENPHLPVSQLEYIPATEKDFLLTGGPESPAYRSVLSLFNERVATSPENIALIYGENKLTYQELDSQSTALAGYLADVCEVRKNDLVGILLDRSPHMIVAMLGILKAGAAYVPVDTAYPALRQEQIISETGMKVLLTQTAYAFELSYFEGQIFAMDVQLDTLPAIPSQPADEPAATDYAYVIFTSGSTGKPKGCTITHGNLANYIQWAAGHYFDTAQQGNFGLFTSLSFDLTVTSIFCPLVRGTSLYIYPQEAGLADILTHAFSNSSGIDSIKLTPSHINFLQGLHIQTSDIACAIVGGEEVLLRHVEILKNINPAIKIYNEYGPTEATVGCMVELLEQHQPVSIGKPINGTGIYILDTNLSLCGIGVSGEICIGGVGVSVGYLHLPELTAEKFIADPFHAGERLYKTGDIGRVLPDGRIAYQGRRDEQVKVRGFRIEPGEVEAAICSFTGITAAAVTTIVAADGNRELVAYMTGSESQGVQAIRSHIEGILPFYMVPSHYVILDKIPLTVHGKIDWKALPDPLRQDLNAVTQYVVPATRTEEVLQKIWSEVLSLRPDQISIKDNFFNLGGHSLKATRLASLIYKEFEVKIELRVLFNTTILEEQAKLIDESGKLRFAEIPVAQKAESYELSSSQRRLWILSRFRDSNAAYNIPGAYAFKGVLDRNAFAAAFCGLLQRHEILRTIFREDQSDKPRQFILTPEELAFQVGYTDLRNEQDQEQQMKAGVQEIFTTPFDLSTGPLLRASLFHLSDDNWVFAYALHHIISDDGSSGIMIQELLALYNAHLQGVTDPLPPLRIQYKDYAEWQQVQLKEAFSNVKRNYWKLCFEGELPILALPGDYPRPAIKAYTGGIAKKWLSPELSQQIQEVLKQQDVTLYMGLVAVVNVLLYRFTGQEDIIVGSSVNSRQHADLENQIGFYVNTLALRVQFSGQDSYQSLLEKVKQVTIGAYEHQDYPFDEIIEQLNLQRDMSRHPLFEVMVVLQRHRDSGPAVSEGMNGLQVNTYDGNSYIPSKFDLTFFFTESATGDLHLSIIYNNTIYKEHTALRMLDNFEVLAAAIANDTSDPIYQLPVLTGQEEQQLLNDFNTSAIAFPQDKTIVDLFREQAASKPDAPALVFESKALSYAELDRQSDEIAAYLQSNYGITAGDRVGLLIDRSDRMIVGILGAMKAGAAYVPIEPDFPKGRKAFLLKDSEVKVLLTESHHFFDIDYYDGNVYAIDIQISNEETISVGAGPAPADPAYVIYTSGSTGQPKGVMISHCSLVDYVYGLKARTNIQDCRTFGLMSTPAADLGHTVIYSSLMLGACLHIFPAASVMDPEKLAAVQLDCIKIVPSHWKALQDGEKPFIPSTTLIFGGEQLTKDVIALLVEKGAACQVYNHYGPTETTVGKLINHISLKDFASKISLGSPFGNTRIYIVDKYGQLCPTGVVGEICIAGEGLAISYLNQPELTKEKFTEAAFKKGERIYRTGDLGRWLPDGTVEFMGRKDVQLKIRGYRIEPGEIENALLAFQGVTNAVVIAREGVLLAYLTAHDALATDKLLSYLSNLLPSYMIPASFIQVPQIPLTANGKIDKAALPDPVGARKNDVQCYMAPRSEKEKALVTVFEDVLKKSPVGVTDNFFVLGGDSIKSIQIISRLKRLGFTLAIQDILLNPVLEELAVFVTADTNEISQDVVTGQVQLSPIQRYFLEQDNGQKQHFNQAVLLYSRQPLDEKAIAAIFEKILQHHDALRMVFTEIAGGWTQECKDEGAGFSLEVVNETDPAAYAAHYDRIHTSFNLSAGPLFKVALFHGTDGDRLLMVAHHLIIDGVSWRIIFEDLSALYQQYSTGQPLSMPAKTHSFKYWMDKQTAYAWSDKLREEASYWSAVDSAPLVHLQPDHPAGSYTKKDSAVSSVLLGKEQTNLLLTQCYKAYKTDINDILLAALSLAFYRQFNMDSVVIRLEGHGREAIAENIDISRTIGWFTTHYPVVLTIKDGENNLRQLLEVKEYLHRIPNKGIGYGILRYITGKDYTISPEISFNYLGDFGSGVSAGNDIPLFEFSGDYKGREVPDDRVRDILLNVNCMVAEGQLRISIEYSAEQYERSTIDRLLELFRMQLEGLIKKLSTEDKVHFTPVDFTYKGLNLEQLEELDKL